jgi:allantoinase
MNFFLKSNRVLVNGELFPSVLEIEGKFIKEIFSLDKFISMNIDNNLVQDFGSHVLMPAIVDTHAHINEPGRTDWEGFVTATKAALAGGITTVIDMPLNSIPATTSFHALQVKREAAMNKCSIDYGFWGGVVPGNQNELIKMVNDGCFGFKAFMCESGVAEFQYSKDEDLEIAMNILKDLDVPLLIHAEVELPHSHHDDDHSQYETYLKSRPNEWEDEAIKRLIKLIEKTGCRAHIVHLSSASALSLIEAAKQKGLPLTVETCPHYLSITSEEIQDKATHFKCAPPIREKENQELLWSAVKSGLIDFIVSDHSPCTPHLKHLDKGDFISAWGGIASIQFSLPVVWTQMHKRGISLPYLSKMMSENTSKFCGISHKKGILKKGYLADILVFAPEEEFILTAEMIFHKHKITPYLGQKLLGVVKKVFKQGEELFDNGNFLKINSGKELNKF